MEGSSEGLRKGAWTAEEDGLLRQCIDTYGEGKWHQIPLRSGLNRCSKSCRERWLNYLKPSIKRGKFGSDEVDLLLRLHKLLGNRWSLIAGRLPGRTANDVKNYWNTQFGKKQEPCGTSKTRKREISCSAASQPQKFSLIKPRTQSYNGCSQRNGQKEVELGNVSNKDDSIPDNKDEEKYEFLNSLMDEDIMWWPENLLEDSQEGDRVGPVATTIDKTDNCFNNSMFSTLDNEQLWSMFNLDTREVD